MVLGQYLLVVVAAGFLVLRGPLLFNLLADQTPPSVSLQATGIRKTHMQVRRQILFWQRQTGRLGFQHSGQSSLLIFQR
jgi:hypothetical protein